MSNTNATVLVRVWAGLLLIFTLAPAAAQTTGCEQVLTLADLERMALQANPTSAQSQAAIAQRYRILNNVRMLFYEALGAQRRVETRAELVRIAREAVGVTEQLFNVGQADRPDAYEIEIEAQRAQLDLIMAE